MTDFSKLDWSLLKFNGCPKCGAELEQIPDTRVRRCTDCDFTISEDKINDIINDRKTKTDD